MLTHGPKADRFLFYFFYRGYFFFFSIFITNSEYNNKLKKWAGRKNDKIIGILDRKVEKYINIY